MQDIEKVDVDKMVEQNVVFSALSIDWAAPVVFVPEKDSTLRFCVHYRCFNALIVRDACPISWMDECIKSL